MGNNILIKKRLGWIERYILNLLELQGVFNEKQSWLAEELGARNQDVNAAFKRLERANLITMEKIQGELCKKVILRGGHGDK